MLGGIEKTENGSLIAIVYYKDFRTVIPITEMMINLVQDEVSFVVTHIGEERNVAVGLISWIIRQNLWYLVILRESGNIWLPITKVHDILFLYNWARKKADAISICPLV